MVRKDQGITGRVIVVVSGGFDPFPHAGHIAHLRMAKSLGDYLVVIVNTDQFLNNKKGMTGTPLADRLEMIRAIRYVDDVIACIDKDQTVAETLRLVRPQIFAKGGDRSSSSRMPASELSVCTELGIKIVYGAGGKIRHSTGWEWHGGDR